LQDCHWAADENVKVANTIQTKVNDGDSTNAIAALQVDLKFNFAECNADSERGLKMLMQLLQQFVNEQVWCIVWSRYGA
jgi:hypothetical protein